jgi:hypothetical protein
MSLPGLNNKKGKQDNKAQKNSNANQGGSKFIPKQAKFSNASKKANRTGGTRGS